MPAVRDVHANICDTAYTLTDQCDAQNCDIDCLSQNEDLHCAEAALHTYAAVLILSGKKTS